MSGSKCQEVREGVELAVEEEEGISRNKPKFR